MTSPADADDRAFMNRALETAIRLGLVALLLFWCFQVVRPFIQPVVWGVVLAIALQPAYLRLRHVLAGNSLAAAALLIGSILLLLIIPAVLLMSSLVESGTELAGALQSGAIDVPPPPASVAEWPVVGKPVHAFWATASRSLAAAVGEIQPQLEAVGIWLLGALASTGLGIVMFALALVIAGVLLASGETSSGAAAAVARRLAGERGDALVHLTAATIQSVTRGILGVALIQSVAAGLGMLLAGVPAAGLWALGVLMLAVIQLPTLLVLGPVAVYVFYASSTTVAVLFAIWAVVVGASDNVLKPLLLGRGVEVPMLVIFMGAIGGFILDGIIGLFVGAVVLAIGYTLFNAWLDGPQPEASS
jgi:predicted PurR-regulated permease PerM